MASHERVFLHTIACFIIATAGLLGHSAILSVELSDNQKAIEKHLGFGHIIVSDPLGLPRNSVISQHDLPHGYILILMLFCKLDICMTINSWMKTLYESKHCYLLRLTLLDIPETLGVFLLIALSISISYTTEFILYINCLIYNLASLPFLTFANGNEDTIKNEAPLTKEKRKSARRKLSHECKDTKDNQNDGSKPPFKLRKRSSTSSTPDIVCEIWLQVGRDPNSAHKHKMDVRSYLVGERAKPMSDYESYSTVNVNLSCDNRICEACNSDYKDNHQREPRVAPRWFKQLEKNVKCPEVIHCSLCHQEWTRNGRSQPSPCKENKNVHSSTWRKGQSVKFWNKVLSSPPFKYTPNLRESSDLCRRHFMQIQELYVNKQCLICKKSKCSNLSTVSMLSQKCKQSILHNVKKPDCEIHDEWVCDNCIDVHSTSNIEPDQCNSLASNIPNSTSTDEESAVRLPLKDLLEANTNNPNTRINHSSVFL